MIIAVSFAIAIILLICLLIGIAYSAFFKLTSAKPKSIEECFEVVHQKGLYSKERFAQLDKELVKIKSADGLTMHGYFIEPYKEENKVVVLVHGYTDAAPWMMQYADFYLSIGFNVLAYDLRRHGESEGKYSTLGYKEKEDLGQWIKWLRERKGEDCFIGLHGQSMGAATVLEYGTDKSGIGFVISDSGYSDLYKLVKYMAKQRNVPFNLSGKLLDMLLYHKAGFKMKDVSPIQTVKNSSVPTLFIHGTGDKIVPYKMSEELYEAKQGLKRLLLIEGAKHCQSYLVNRELYEKEVKDFIDEALKYKNQDNDIELMNECAK